MTGSRAGLTAVTCSAEISVWSELRVSSSRTMAFSASWSLLRRLGGPPSTGDFTNLSFLCGMRWKRKKSKLRARNEIPQVRTHRLDGERNRLRHVGHRGLDRF